MPRSFTLLLLTLSLAVGVVGVCSITQAQERPRLDDPSVPTAPSAPYWSDTWRGWHFYEEPDPEPSDAPASAPKPPANAPTPPIPAAPKLPTKAPELVEFERLQKAVESYRNIAIMRPTEANVRRYMALEAKVVARASYFADVAQHVAWSTPELDPTQQGRPVNARALEVFDRDQLAERSQSKTMCCSFSSEATALTAMPWRPHWPPSKHATA